MSQENVEVVRRAHEAYERGDRVEMVKDIDPEAIIWRELPDSATFDGPEGLSQMIADWEGSFDEFNSATHELIDANDHQVVARIHQTGVGARSGVRTEADWWFVHTLRGAKIIRVDIFPSEARALKAAGLRE